MTDSTGPSKEAIEAAAQVFICVFDRDTRRNIAWALDVFAAAARAEERERCAQIADEAKTQAYEREYPDLMFQADGIADAIRSGAEP